MTVLVSIIIPFYNRFNLVEEALNMLVKQTYQNFEVVLVNDGSEGDFEIEHFKSQYEFPIKYDKLQRNSGPGAARRRGRELAEGDFIVYLDSDDWWSANFLEACIKLMEKNPSMGMVYTNTIRLKNGIETERRVGKNIPTTILPTIFVHPKRFWSTPSCMWRKEVSLSEHWMLFRNHEDYLHDILCSKISNEIGFVSSAFTYNNHSAENRIFRDNDEVRKVLNTVIRIEHLPVNSGISYFFIKRMYKNKITINRKEISKLLKLPFREYGLFNKKWILFQILVLLNFFEIKLNFQKRNIEKLKP